MSSHLRSLGSKPLLDADDRRVGRVAGSQVVSATSDPTWLLVEIAPETARRLGAGSRFRWLPYDAVGRIRRDAVHLAERWRSLLADRPRSRPP